jgi:hypothetical protein
VPAGLAAVFDPERRSSANFCCTANVLLFDHFVGTDQQRLRHRESAPLYMATSHRTALRSAQPGARISRQRARHVGRRGPTADTRRLLPSSEGGSHDAVATGNKLTVAATGCGLRTSTTSGSSRRGCAARLIFPGANF